jgi:hypothetical protein
MSSKKKPTGLTEEQWSMLMKHVQQNTGDSRFEDVKEVVAVTGTTTSEVRVAYRDRANEKVLAEMLGSCSIPKHRRKTTKTKRTGIGLNYKFKDAKSQQSPKHENSAFARPVLAIASPDAMEMSKVETLEMTIASPHTHYTNALVSEEAPDNPHPDSVGSPSFTHTHYTHALTEKQPPTK